VSESTTTPITEGVRFLNTLFSGVDTCLIRPIETWNESNGKKSSRVDYHGISHWRMGQPADFASSRLQRVEERAARERTNTFFGTCPRFAGNGEYDRAFQIRRINTLWCDIDDTHDLTALSERIKAAGLPEPSVIVDSGNGFHVYWVLESPYLIDDCGDPPPIKTEWIQNGDGKKPHKFYVDGDGEKHYLRTKADEPPLSDKAQHITDILQGVAAAIGGDHTFDLARILRVPGTLNRKNQRNGTPPVPCRMVKFSPELKYPIETFASFAEKSPAKAEREKIAKVKLPKPKKLTPKREDGLNERILLCDTAPQGARSEVDFSLLCWCIEQGIDRQEVWSRVQGVGKFAERGERYFSATWEKAASQTREKIWSKANRKATVNASGNAGKGESAEPKTQSLIANAVVDDSGENVEIIPIEMAVILEHINREMGGWPRRLNDALFIDDKQGGVCWLQKPASLFGWLSRERGVIPWHRARGCVSKEEVFAETQRTAERYEAIEYFPHEPRIPDHYYTCEAPLAGDGKRLEELVAYFCPETEVDRDLIRVAFATPLWGGPSGCRPAFMFTATKGRGRGKSKLAQYIAYLWGGYIDISPNEEADKIKTRLLTPSALSLRVAVLDNVKTNRFSWGELEALITSPVISGKRMYEGNASRPNLLTWLITLNGASLSTDLAQRVVEVRLADPTYNGTWEERLRSFIDTHRQAIIGDLLAFLRSAPKPIKTATRWAAWERDVLSRVANPEVSLAVIMSRREQMDVEKEEGEIIEDYFSSRLRSLEYDPERDDVFIFSDIASRWFNAATNDNRKVAGVTRTLRQLHDEGRTTRILPSRAGGTGERGVRWVGEFVGASNPTKHDIRRRIAERLESRKDRKTSESEF